MAATVSSVWSKPGAWALDSEEQESMESVPSHPQTNTNTDSLEFPSLSLSHSHAASTKPSKKKKPQKTLSLSEFTTGKAVSHGAAKIAPPKGLTTDELIVLPTGPRSRPADDPLPTSSSRFGGGRISYGEDSGAGSRWGSSSSSSHRVSDNDARRSREPSGPSRADEIDDWGAAKKSIAPAPRFERKEKGGFFDSQSRADESERWVSNKSYAPVESRRIGGGFESYRDKKGGSEANGGAGSDPWGKKKEEGSGSGRPRLALQPRSVPVVSNGEQQPQQQPGSVTKSKGSNPFGEARPREAVLAEKGQDWKKIDEKLESVKIKESEGPSFGKKSFGTGNGQASGPEERTEKSWRKTADSIDATPRSEKVDNSEAQT
ncbi:hypothetical protein AAC387_Pa01g1055 [Persea americana]